MCVCACVHACVSSMDIIRVNILFSYIVFIEVFVKILTNLPYNKATILTVDTQRHPKQQNFLNFRNRLEIMMTILISI